ncbi:MAG: helix-hairpin-helix domain-containing protein [Longimicrobiales bacterium]
MDDQRPKANQPVPPRPRLSNQEVAKALDRVGDLLEAQHANPFRVRAYHHGADIIGNLDRSVVDVLQTEGAGGLEAIPGIGTSLASAVEELASTDRLGLLERLEGEVSPEDVFTTIPGIGEELAARIHSALHIGTLEELELAAADGTLGTVKGFGPRRVRAVREVLSASLPRSTRRRTRERRPSVALLLDVDAEYLLRAKEGGLRRIRPKRFNPENEAWLPVLHTERGGWWFTALFSNTRRAHALNRTHDWVVLFFEEDGREDQCTVVTEYQGGLAGRRVVRGRELECYDYYYPHRRPEAEIPAAAS